VTCKEGEQCKDGICFTTDGGVGGGGTTTTTGTGTGTGTTTSAGGSGQGGSGQGGSGQGGGTSTGTTGPSGSATEPKQNWGLAQGGACRCALPGERPSGRSGADALALAGLALVAAAARRRPRR
jgi:hypothetical protein